MSSKVDTADVSFIDRMTSDIVLSICQQRSLTFLHVLSVYAEYYNKELQIDSESESVRENERDCVKYNYPIPDIFKEKLVT